MIQLMDGRGLNYRNYGCAGRGNMDADEKTMGRPVDDVDKALNIRKHCIRCASEKFGVPYSSYQFDVTQLACGKKCLINFRLSIIVVDLFLNFEKIVQELKLTSKFKFS